MGIALLVRAESPTKARIIISAVVCENRIFTMTWDQILNIAVEEGIIKEKDVCFEHSKKHNVTRSQVEKLNCEDLPCFKDCPLME